MMTTLEQASHPSQKNKKHLSAKMMFCLDQFGYIKMNVIDSRSPKGVSDGHPMVENIFY